jgi:hypothetical protein
LWEKRLGTKSDEMVRLLLGKLTTARWYLDAAASLRGNEAEDRLRKARDVCDEIERCLVGLELNAETDDRIQLALTELRSRLRPTEEL